MALYKGLDLDVSGPAGSEQRGFFEAAGRGELVVQRCLACGEPRGQIGAGCPFCTSLEWEWRPVAGTGTIYSYQIVTQAVHPAFADWVPYPVVLVELDEARDRPWRGGVEGESVSVRKVANLVRPGDPARPEAEEKVAIGLRVKACFADLGDGLALPQFTLTGDPPEHAPWRAGERDG